MKKFFSTLFIAGLALPALAGEPQPLPQGFDYSTVTTHFTGCLDGQIDGMGTHEELLASNAIYREVFYSQQKGGEEHA